MSYISGPTAAICLQFYKLGRDGTYRTVQVSLATDQRM
jgi:hypothetical protein